MSYKLLVSHANKQIAAFEFRWGALQRSKTSTQHFKKLPIASKSSRHSKIQTAAHI